MDIGRIDIVKMAKLGAGWRKTRKEKKKKERKEEMQSYELDSNFANAWAWLFPTEVLEGIVQEVCENNEWYLFNQDF